MLKHYLFLPSSVNIYKEILHFLCSLYWNPLALGLFYDLSLKFELFSSYLSLPINCKLLEDKICASFISVCSVSHKVLNTFYLLNKCLLNDWMSRWTVFTEYPSLEWQAGSLLGVLSMLLHIEHTYCSDMFLLFRNYTTMDNCVTLHILPLALKYLFSFWPCKTSESTNSLIHLSNIHWISAMCKAGHYIRHKDESDIIQSSRETQ